MTTNYDIYLGIDGGQQRILLPVNPSELPFPQGSMNQSITTMGVGETTAKQKSPARTFTISSRFPPVWDLACRVPEDELLKPLEYFSAIQAMKDGDKPIRLIISGMDINVLVTIEQFEPSEGGGAIGEIIYTLSLKEFRSLSIRTITPAGTIVESNVRPDTREESSTYTVMSGDSLYKIAVKKLGDASRRFDIAKLNNIKSPYVIQSGQVLQMPKKV